MSKNRTDNTIKNIAAALFVQLAITVLSFVTRTALIRVLGIQAAGLNGLFVEVIAILSLTEMGVGSAIIYNLYKPLSANDEKKVCQLMTLFRTAYNYVTLAVLVLDGSRSLTAEDEEAMALAEAAPHLIVAMNKSDLPRRLDVGALADRFDNVLSVSAATGEGLDTLAEAIAAQTKDAIIAQILQIQSRMPHQNIPQSYLDDLHDLLYADNYDEDAINEELAKSSISETIKLSDEHTELLEQKVVFQKLILKI